MKRWIARCALGMFAAASLMGAEAEAAAKPPPKAVAKAPAKPTAAAAPNSRAQFEAGMLRTPVYPVMKQYYPEAYNGILKRGYDGFIQGKPIVALQAEMRPAYLALLKAQLPKAEPALVMSLLELSRTEVQGLVANPPACMAFLGFTPFQVRADQLLSPELAKQDMQLSADILKQAATHPYARTAPREAPLATPAELALIAYDAMPSDDSRKRLMRLSGNIKGATDPSDQRAVCEYMVGFFGALLKQKPEDAAEIFATAPGS